MIDTLSLFSGGGGLDLGFIQSGYNIIWACDINKDAVNTYRYNLGDHIHLADLNQINPQTLPKADLIIGGPPCQAYSLSGKRDVKDPRAILIWTYLDILQTVRPKAFLFENVIGLLSAKDLEGNKVFPALKEAFESLGYMVSWKIVNAADYGVPQKRRRVIVVGLLGDSPYEFPAPTHGIPGKKWVSVKEALEHLPPASQNSESLIMNLDQSNYSEFEKLVADCDIIEDHFIPSMSDLDRYIISHVPPGGNYQDIPDEVNSKRIQRLKREGGHTTCYGRMIEDEPSYTINTYFNRPNVGCNIHYHEDRLITIREAMRLQSFPDSFHLIASSKQAKHLIVGNAVPPLLAKALAERLKEYL